MHDNTPMTNPGSSPIAPRIKLSNVRKYGFLAVVTALATSAAVASSSLPSHTIVAFGDSYFSGYGVLPQESFPAQLQHALREHGHRMRVLNEGVDGETIADGLARLDRTLASKPDLIILELGANDAEQGVDPVQSLATLDIMIARIRAAHVPLLLCGAVAPQEAGDSYKAQFDPIFATLAAKHQVPLYPSILEGVFSDSALIQDDGEHPNPKGVLVMVNRILPRVEDHFRTAQR